MSAFLVALGFAALPAAGNVLGGLLSEITRVSDKTLSFALHLAAGMVVAVVGLELMGRGLDSGVVPWVLVAALVAGGVFAVLLDLLLAHIRQRFVADPRGPGPWMIYVGVAADLFSDGVMIGAGATVASSLALLLALGQTVGDVPGGFATLANFRRLGMPRARRLLVGGSLALPVLLGCSLGYWAVRGEPAVYQFALLAFTAGILITVAIEEMVAQAHTLQAGGKETAWEPLGLVAGFGLFALLSAYLE